MPHASLTTTALITVLLLVSCGPPRPEVTFEDVRMDATGLSFVLHTTPGARVTGGPTFAPQTADAEGRARYALPLAEVTTSEYRFGVEVEGTFSSAFGQGVLTLPMSAEEAAMVRPDGTPALAVHFDPSAESGAGSCSVSGDYGAGDVPLGASGHCAFTLLAPEGTTVAFDARPVDLAAPFEVDFGPQLAALTASPFGFVGSVSRSYAVSATSASGATATGTLEVRSALLAPVLRGQVAARAGHPLVEGGAPDPDHALLIGPATQVTLVGRGTPASVAGSLASASRVAVATDGATHEAPPCTGYTVEGGGVAGSLARVTTDVELVVYDAATTSEIGRATVPGGGTGCPTVADSDDVVQDRPTTETLAAAIWAMQG